MILKGEMMKLTRLRSLVLASLLFCSLPVWSGDSFELTVLGDRGGIQDGNLTAFLLKAEQDSTYLTLDAGTLISGLEAAIKKGAFSDISVPKESEYGLTGYILREKIQGYLISHSHLDHVAGMVIASPADSKKNIYALPATNKALSDTYFNWLAWPNFGNTGEGYKIGLYNYVDIPIGQSQEIENTSLKVTPFPLSHSSPSGAFIIENQDNVMVFFGDTGPDEVEKSDNLNNIWVYLSDKVKRKQLKGLVIEVSFVNETKDKQLFGHLTPKWLFNELSKFEEIAGGEGSLDGLKVVISHIKYSLKKGKDPRDIIKQQLDALNDLGVDIIISEQGQQIKF